MLALGKRTWSQMVRQAAENATGPVSDAALTASMRRLYPAVPPDSRLSIFSAEGKAVEIKMLATRQARIRTALAYRSSCAAGICLAYNSYSLKILGLGSQTCLVKVPSRVGTHSQPDMKYSEKVRL